MVNEWGRRRGRSYYKHKDLKNGSSPIWPTLKFAKNILKTLFAILFPEKLVRPLSFGQQETRDQEETILNEYAMKMFSREIQSDFAMQITFDIQEHRGIRPFSKQQSHGFTSFLRDNKTSKTRVCITVGMMTTGIWLSGYINILCCVQSSPNLICSDQSRGQESIPSPKSAGRTDGSNRKKGKREFQALWLLRQLWILWRKISVWRCYQITST